MAKRHTRLSDYYASLEAHKPSLGRLCRFKRSKCRFKIKKGFTFPKMSLQYRKYRFKDSSTLAAARQTGWDWSRKRPIYLLSEAEKNGLSAKNTALRYEASFEPALIAGLRIYVYPHGTASQFLRSTLRVS